MKFSIYFKLYVLTIIKIDFIDTQLLMIGNSSEFNGNNSNLECQIMIIKMNNSVQVSITRRKSIIKYRVTVY